MEDIITVGVVNWKAERGNLERNASRMAGYIRAAARRGADLVLFPELALTGYCDDTDKPMEEKLHVREAMGLDDEPVLSLRKAARDWGVYAVFGMPERGEDGKYYNSAVACCPDGTVASYRKIHPFFEENNWASKGDSPLLLETPYGKIGIGICHDTYSFPELSRYYAGKGARLYLNLTALGLINTWDDFYKTTLESLVIHTGMFVASANLCGSDSNSTFPGGSVILGPSLGWLMSPQHTYCRTYAGGISLCDEELFLATLDLSCALQGLFEDNPRTGEPDFRPGLYEQWYRELAQGALVPPTKEVGR